MNHRLNRKLAYENCKDHLMRQDFSLYFFKRQTVETAAKAQFSQRLLFGVIDYTIHLQGRIKIRFISVL